MTPALPTGTVTFMFTDIEGSTKLVQELVDAWPPVLEQHDEIGRAAITARGGVLVRSEGDAVFAAFADPLAAVLASVDFQRGLAAHEWPEGAVIRIRIGLHTGVGALGGADYVGIDVHRAARIAATPHGGQTVISEATASLVERSLPEGIELRDLGKHRLKDLTDREAIFQVVAADLHDQFPPLRSLERVAHNLPVQMTSFVGREGEIQRAVDLLRTARVVTLLGPGGTGKSRLSLQVAAECAEDFPDGTFFVPLAPVTDPALVPSTILGALGVPASTRRLPPREHLIDFFSQRSSLLVLDNFEQVIAAGDVVADLVRCSEGSRILVTSRIPLHIAGEQEMPIDPLPTTDPMGVASAPAVQLFVERASAVRPDFALTDDNVDDVVTLVQRLDGLPLAIELVVSQLRLLPVAAVLERLDPSRLGGATRDAPERHQTLWNAIDWSVEGLSEVERTFLTRLAVFVGGARLEEVEAVCSDLPIDPIEGLTRLIERSLLLPGDSTEDVRFRWLRVIREYCMTLLEESGELDGVQREHAGAYLDLAELAATEILSRRRRRWIEALDRDHDNLRAAITWSIERGEVDMAMRFGWALWRFWQSRGHVHEARAAIESILRMDGGSPFLRAKAVEAAGGIAWWQGDMDEADRLYVEALAMQRGLADRREIANAAYNAALTQAYGFQNGEAAGVLLREAEGIYRDLDDSGGLANVFWGQGSLAFLGGAGPSESRQLLEQAVKAYAAADNVFGEGWAHFELGALLTRLGSVDEAEPHLIDGLRLLWDSRDYSAVVMFMALFGWVSFQRDDRIRAVTLAGAAYALRDHSGVDLMSIEANRIEGMSIEDMEALDGEDAIAYERGRAMGYDEAVAFALREA